MKTMNDESEIMREINWVYNQLSPENLSCDGELSLQAMNVKRSRLNIKLAGLQRKLGRTVSEREALQWSLNNRV